MAFEFKLPDIGEGVHEGEIAKWLVAPGQMVKEDQPMVEVMTDKVTVEITCPVAGTIGQVLYNEGDVVHVGSVIITIEEGESTSAALAKAMAAVAALVEAPIQDVPQAKVSCVTPPPIRSSGKVLAAPAVRKLARSMGVDLAVVTGTGPRGRVRKDDLKCSGVSVVPSIMPKPSIVPSLGEERIAYKGMRRKIGDHLVRSKQTVPHFTYVEEADMTALNQFRQDLAPLAQAADIKLTYLPFIIKAVIEGLKKYPKLNSSLDETTQEIVLKHYYNIGIAVATGDGLVVPVIHHAEHKTVLELAQDIATLSQKARNNKLALTDLQGGTFTLTSIGSIGGIFSAPIVNHPEVAIMGIQKVEKRPVVRNDEIVIREMTYLSISGDHRVVDGAEVALFMKDVVEWLEHPARLLWVSP